MQSSTRDMKVYRARACGKGERRRSVSRDKTKARRQFRSRLAAADRRHGFEGVIAPVFTKLHVS